MQRRLEQVGEQSATKVRPLGTPPVPQRPAETQESAIRR